MHLKAIHEDCHLFIGIADVDEGQRSRISGIWQPRTVWIDGRNFLIPVLGKSLPLLWGPGTHGGRIPHPEDTMDVTCSTSLPLIPKPIVV